METLLLPSSFPCDLVLSSQGFGQGVDPEHDVSTIPTLDRIHLMQFLALQVAKWMPYWTSGTVRLDRIEHGWKLPDKHHCNADKVKQVWMRRHRVPRTRLVILDPHAGTSKLLDPDHAEWWMLSTGPIEGEKLLDARRGDQRIHLGEFWELVRLTGPSGLTWTWRANPKSWQELCRHAVAYAKLPDLRRAQEIMDDLCRWPGFAGIRRQRAALFHEMRWVSKQRLIVPRTPYPRFLPRTASCG